MTHRLIAVAVSCSFALYVTVCVPAFPPTRAQQKHSPNDATAAEGAASSEVHFSGEVLRGQIYEHDVGHGMVFRLTPAVSDMGGGWVIGMLPSVQPADELLEFVEVATPPYHGYNDRYVAGAEGYSSREAIQQPVRKFYFVQSVEDQHIASEVVNAHLYPNAASEEEKSRIDTEADALNLGSGQLHIVKSRITPGKGGPETIAWIKFEVELNFSPGVTLKSVLAPQAPTPRSRH